MADIINIGNEGFASLHSVCRRFGKSMAAKMLCAYYDQSCSSDSLFSDLQIASDPTYPTHLNKYPVIYLDMTFFTTNCKNQDTMVEWMDRWIKSDLQKIYPQVPSAESQPLISYLLALAEHQGKRFIMIIDEWDAICRETSHSSELMRRYVDWLRSMYSVLDPEPLQGYFGFTEEETKALKKRTYSNYWMQTGAYEGLKRYLTYNRSTGTVRIPNNEDNSITIFSLLGRKNLMGWSELIDTRWRREVEKELREEHYDTLPRIKYVG